MIEIFVFGSNLAGIHGAGSARHALEYHGAIMGEGIGLHGSSYAIPTKDKNIQTMKISEIKPHVDEFIKFAANHPEMTFNIVAIGCGLAGFRPQQIAPLFAGCPSNCNLPKEFKGEQNEEN